jgi:hypothetical protein
MSMGAFLVMFADAALAEAVDKAAGLAVDEETPCWVENEEDGLELDVADAIEEDEERELSGRRAPSLCKRASLRKDVPPFVFAAFFTGEDIFQYPRRQDDERKR